MKSKVSIILAVMMAFMMCVGTAGAAKVELGLCQPQTLEHPQGQMVERIIKRVDELTNGEVKIRHYPADQLGTQEEVYRQTIEGSNAIFVGDFTQVAQYYEPISVFNLYYVFNNPDHMINVLTSDLAKDMYAKIEETSGLRVLNPIYFGTRVMSTKGVQATKPEDLAGVSIRCPQGAVSVDCVNSLGCTAVPMGLSEVYMALQTGTLQGQENPLATFVSKAFYEVQDTILLTNHMIGFSVVIVNAKLWEQIPEQYRADIEKIFVEEAEVMKQEMIASESDLRKQCEDNGVTFIEPDFEAFKNYSLNYTSQIYSDYADLLDQIAAM